MAMAWLRTKEIFIEIGIYGRSDIKFSFSIIKRGEGEIYPTTETFYNTYEEATEAALLYCLTNLI